MLEGFRGFALGLTMFATSCVTPSNSGLSVWPCAREVLRHGWCGEDADVLPVRLRIQGSLCALLNAQLQRLQRGLEPLGDDWCRKYMSLQSESAQRMP